MIAAGFLRLYKPHILGEFEAKIDDVLNSDVTTYPNYKQIESILQQAKIYYPDSHKIEVLALDIQSSKHSTLLSIARQINSHLEKSLYTQQDEAKSIYDLKRNSMKYIKSTLSLLARWQAKSLVNTSMKR